MGHMLKQWHKKTGKVWVPNGAANKTVYLWTFYYMRNLLFAQVTETGSLLFAVEHNTN